MPHTGELVYEGGSLEELLELLEGPHAPQFPNGGWIRIHPDRLAEPGLEEYTLARQRAALYGLRLVVTPYVPARSVELRRRAASRVAPASE